MTFRTAALAVALAAFATTGFAAKTAGNNFVLVDSNGKTIGNASYTIDKGKDGGYKVKTRFEYHLSAAANSVADDASTRPSGSGPGGGNGAALVDVQETGEYKFDDTGNFLTGFTQNLANQMMTSFEPDKKRDSVTISHRQAGVAGASTNLPVPAPQFLLAPDFDPSAIQMLLTTAITHPHADSTYLLIVPGVGGRAVDNSLYVTLQVATDSPAGTLDGKPAALKHYLMNYHTGHADLYADADGNLMDAVMAPLNASYVRAKFELAKP